MTRIPRHFHFIFGLKPQSEPFHIAWYLCLKSCIVVNQPHRIFFHYQNEPHGEWWERIKPELELVPIEASTTTFDQSLYDDHDEGRFIKRANLQYAHLADILRLQILRDHGGVYADIDTLFVRPYPDNFYSHPCLMGKENNPLDPMTLCNAVILAEKGSNFVSTWLEQMFQVFDGTWNRHSCMEPALLSEKDPTSIEIVDADHFFHFNYDKDGLTALFGRTSEVPADLLSIHMWNHLWWEDWRNDFISFHGGHITEDFIRNYDTTYNLLARPFLNQEP